MNQKKILVRRHLGALKARRQRHRPSDLVWSGDDILCEGRGDPHPLWRSSLVEPGAKVIVIVFTEKTWWPTSNTLSECYNNVDVGVTLWLPNHGINTSEKSLLSPIPLFKLPYFILTICMPLLS